jgi:hypothetical protein
VIWLHFQQCERQTGEGLGLFAQGNDCDPARCGGKNARHMKVGADCDRGTKACGKQSRAQTFGQSPRWPEQSLGSCDVQDKRTCDALTCLLNTRREDGRALKHDVVRGGLAFKGA